MRSPETPSREQLRVGASERRDAMPHATADTPVRDLVQSMCSTPNGASRDVQSAATVLRKQWDGIVDAIIEGRVPNAYGFFMQHAMSLMGVILDQLAMQEERGRAADTRIDELRAEVALMREEASESTSDHAKVHANDHPEMKVSPYLD